MLERGGASLAALVVIGALLVGGAVPAQAATAAAADDFFEKVWEVQLPGTIVGESSPLLVDLDADGIEDVVFGTYDGRVLALSGLDGRQLWSRDVGTRSTCVNSSASAADIDGDNRPEIFIGTGCANQDGPGSVYSFEHDGTVRFAFVARDPNFAYPYPRIHSSPAIADIDRDGVAEVVFGSLSVRSIWAIDVNGNLEPGFPYYSDDTNFSTAAFTDLNGDGVTDFVIGQDQTWAPGQPGSRGGSIRGMTGDGVQLFERYTNEIIRSAPAIGDVDGDGAAEIVVGTGNHWSNPATNSPYPATDATKIFILSATAGGMTERECETGGNTAPNPALSDFNGDGRLDIVMGTSNQFRPAGQGGEVVVLDGATCGILARFFAGDFREDIIGGVSSADFNGDGKQDIAIPTGSGTYVRNGGDGALLARVNYGQVTTHSTPAITDLDGDSKLDMFTTGWYPGSPPTAVIQRWEVRNTLGGITDSSWPTFHHDARRTGNVTPPPLTQTPVDACAVGDGQGYWMIGADGGVFPFCTNFYGSTGAIRLAAPIVTMAATPSGNGYWLVASDGGVFPFGDAGFYGSTGAIRLNQPIIAMVPTPSGKGYLLIAKDGGVFPFGDANFYGSTGAIRLNQPVITAAMTNSGKGYWLIASDGGIFPFGDAPFFGSTGAIRLNKPIISMLVTETNGYALLASDGGFFPFSDSPFYGSTGNVALARPIVAAGYSPSYDGYWLFGADGAVFPFGDARFLGSLTKIRLNAPVIAAAVR